MDSQPVPSLAFMYINQRNCDLCGQMFLSPGASSETQSKVIYAKTCLACTFALMQGFLQPNNPTDLTENQCLDCNVKFKSRKGLMQHIGKMHDQGQKTDSCPVCQKKFKNKYAVQFHVRQVHARATRVTCNVCDKVFYNKYMLKSHQATDHK